MEEGPAEVSGKLRPEIPAVELQAAEVEEEPVDSEPAPLVHENNEAAGERPSATVAPEPGTTAPETVTPGTDVPEVPESPEPEISGGEAPVTSAAEQPVAIEPDIPDFEKEEDAGDQISTGAAPEPRTLSPPAALPVAAAPEAHTERQSEAASASHSTEPSPVTPPGVTDPIDMGLFIAEETPAATGNEGQGRTQPGETGGGSDVPATETAAAPREPSLSVTAGGNSGMEETPVATLPAVAEEGVQIPSAANGPGQLGVAAVEVMPVIETAPEQRAEENEVEVEATGGAPVPLYRPIAPRPPRPRRPGVTRPENGDRSPARELALDIRVHVTLSRFGLRDITFLPVRSSEIEDSEIRVKSAGQTLTLVAQDDWYQDLYLEDTGGHLRRGIELRGTADNGRRIRWLLSGRTLYVLATHPRANAYVSTNRLMIGRPHVLLCAADNFAPVEEMLRRAGCEGFSRLDEGVPEGWVALRDVTPKLPVLDDLGDNLLNAVKPPPDVEIDLEGGVWLRNQEWLAGYPPEIRVLGATDQIRLFVDDKEAEVRDGRLYAEGYDLPGSHTVYCGGLPISRTYSIVEPAEDWADWPAYHFRDADICGPLVRITGSATKPIIVPMTNPLLIGAGGEVFRCPARNAAQWKGYVPFDVVWALPAQPLTCNKKTSRIIQLGRTPVGTAAAQSRTALSWSNAILNASRKGLQLDGGSPEDGLLWREYKKAARSIWRAAR
jgi:hypothetical protein